MDTSFEKSLKFQAISNGETIAYRSRIHPHSKGNLILIHGWLCSSIVIWDEFLTLLSDLPWSFYAVDMRGFGDSSFNKPVRSLEDLATDIHLFAKALNLKNIVVGGFSTGGGVTMNYAAHYPEELKKIILFDSVPSSGMRITYEKDGKQVQAVKSQEFGSTPIWGGVDLCYHQNMPGILGFENYMMFNAGKKINQEALTKSLEGCEKQRHVADCIYWLTHFNITNENNGILDGNGKINNIKCPALVIHGDKDLMIPVEESEKTAKRIGKLAKFEIIQDCGHCPFMSQPQKSAELVRSFLGDI